MPKADSFSAEHWGREVQRGFDFYFASGRADLAVPKASDIKEYFTSLAPTELKIAAPLALDPTAQNRFAVSDISTIDRAQAMATAGLELADLGDGLDKCLVFSDMRGGSISLLPLQASAPVDPISIAQLQNPGRVHACRLDSNAQAGLLVADLGSFLPADHQAGRVIWLRRTDAASTEFETVVLLDKCGRVADAQADDLDADGDQDIIVSDFGWHLTGQLSWLERTGDGPVSADSFKVHIIDKRPGALETFTTDLNGDGHRDVIALMAQEFETVIAHLGDGRGNFQSVVLFAADDPAFGSSGMSWHDLDKDGDLDCILTNGDSFDSFEVKPYHAIRWLENQGRLKFEAHELIRLPGVHEAVAADIDADGDLDILAAAFLPRDLTSQLPGGQPVAILLLENDGKQSFTPRPLQVGQCLHPAICTGDLNSDGKLDLAVANFYEDPTSKLPAVTLWHQK